MAQHHCDYLVATVNRTCKQCLSTFQRQMMTCIDDSTQHDTPHVHSAWLHAVAHMSSHHHRLHELEPTQHWAFACCMSPHLPRLHVHSKPLLGCCLATATVVLMGEEWPPYMYHAFSPRLSCSHFSFCQLSVRLHTNAANTHAFLQPGLLWAGPGNLSTAAKRPTAAKRQVTI